MSEPPARGPAKEPPADRVAAARPAADPPPATDRDRVAASSGDRSSAGTPCPASESLTDRVRFAAARGDRSLVVLEGFHALKHALRFGAVVERAVTSDPDQLSALADELAPDLREPLLALVSPRSRETLRALAPQLPHTEVVAIARRAPFELAAALCGRPDRPVVLLEDPRHLGNVGAVVRVAAAADAAAVLTTGPRDPWDPAAVRGAAGLQFALPVGSVGDRTREALEAIGEALASAAGLGRASGAGSVGRAAKTRALVALDPEGELLGPVPLPPGAILAFGTERHGLSDELLARADVRVRLPMRAGVSSLNLATAVAATLYAARG